MEIPFETLDVEISAIDLKDKTYERRRGLHKEAVERYKELSPEDSQDPVYLLKRDNHYIVLSGRHRLTAWRNKGVSQVQARVYTDLDDATAIRLCATANATHGVPTTTKERKAAFMDYLRALHDVGREPNIPKDAKAFGISAASAYNYQAELKKPADDGTEKSKDPLKALVRTVKSTPELIKEVTPEMWQSLPFMDRCATQAQVKALIEQLKDCLELSEPQHRSKVQIWQVEEEEQPSAETEN